MQTAISTQELQRRIERLYDHLYANAAMKTPARIAHEVSKVLHASLYIEEVLGEVPAVRENGYRANSLPSAAEAASLSTRLRAAYDDMQQRWALYPENEKIALEDYDLAFVGTQLAGVQISSPDRDVLGDALEIFRSQWSKREGGQFFTDQQVTRLAMDLL
ncbi:MAG: hypothetical protein Q8K89_01175, partial [Actinomycetota bacterium]|nr:hypothetical protein [Actinomycetota bacterium]